MKFPQEFSRALLVSSIDPATSVLEIGPFVSPILTGPNVRYFDVLDKEHLIERAGVHGIDPANAQDIHYISPTGDLSIIDTQFDMVLSSHSIEHNPDLVLHLNHVERLLKDGGRYVVFIPDKRYCFDHFLRESTIADILDARGRKVHTLRSVIEHRAFTTHNNSILHWQDDHGAPNFCRADLLQAALAEYENANGGYIDVHAWQFTPESFERNMLTLRGIGMTGLAVERVYPTVRGAIEFCAVLRR